GARQRRPRGVRPRPAHRPVRVRPHARPERAGGAGGGRARGVPHPMSRPMDGQAEIARFLQQLKWIVLGLVGLWVVWLLAPILTPFVFGALLGWMGDPLVDRLERAGRSRNVAVALVFGLMTLLLVLALLILVPMLERQVRTLVESLPAYRDWFVQTAVPWLEARTGLELMVWLDPERLVQWVREHWQQAGGFATAVFGYISRSGFAMVAWVVNLVLLPILTYYFLR